MVKEKYLLGMDAVRFFRLRYSCTKLVLFPAISGYRPPARGPARLISVTRTEVELMEIVSKSMTWVS